MSKVVVPPFNDLAKQLDPMLPQKDYDLIRLKYFQDHIQPGTAPHAVTGAFADFKKQTERPALLGPLERMMARGAYASKKAIVGAIAPLNVIPGVRDWTDKEEVSIEELGKIMEREGIDPTVAGMIGTGVGMFQGFKGLELAVGPAAKIISGMAFKNARTIALANRALKGGLAGATYEAGADKEGHRLASGLLGAGLGGGGELLLGLPAFLRAKGVKDPAKVAKEIFVENKIQDPKVEEAVSDYLQNQQKAGRAEGHTNTWFVETPQKFSPQGQDITRKGVWAIIETADGHTHQLRFVHGKEDQTIHALSNFLKGGGAIDTYQWHPDDAVYATKIARQIADKFTGKYDDSIFLRETQATAPGQIQKIVPKLSKEAQEAEALAAKNVKPKTSDDYAREHWEAQQKKADELTKQGIPAEVKSGQVNIPVTKIEVPASSAKLTEEWLGSQPADYRKYFDQDASSVRKLLAEKADLAGRDIENALGVSPERAHHLLSFVRYNNNKGLAVVDDVMETAKTEAKTEASATIDGAARRASGEAPKMSRAQAIATVKRLGRDPLTADLDAIMYMGEHELDALFDTVKTQRLARTAEEIAEARATRAGVVDAPTTPDVEIKPHTRVGGEGSLIKQLGFDEAEVGLREIAISGRPGVVRAIVPHSLAEKLTNVLKEDLSAVTVKQWQAGLKQLGVSDDQIAKLDYPDSPLVVFREGELGRSSVYHEGLHANLVNAELPLSQQLRTDIRGTAVSLTSAMSKQKGYEGYSPIALLNEAFTWASQAVRFNDRGLLEKLGKMDGSPAEVTRFVNITAKKLLESSTAKLDTPGVRILQRRLEDLIRRSDDNVITNARNGLRMQGQLIDLDPVTGTWSIGGHKFNSLNEAWDFIAESDISDTLPDVTVWAQVRGIRGPFAVDSSLPGKHLPLPDFSLTQKGGFGWTSVSGWFRPFLPWVAQLDRKVNAIAADKSKHLPIFDAVKRVDEAVRQGEGFLNTWSKKFYDPLIKFDHNQQENLFELLTFKPENWEKAKNHLRLSDEQMIAAKKLAEVAEEYKEASGIDMMNYLQNVYPKLKNNAWQTDAVPGFGKTNNLKSMGTFERALTEGDLLPQDAHMGRFSKWVIDAGYKRKYVAEPIDALEKLVNLKTKEGNYVLGNTRWPLTNYVKYMRGVPDITQQAVNGVIKDFQTGLAARFKEINKSLPASMQLPESFNPPQTVLNRLMLFSYAGGLAMRPAVYFRDLMQVFVTGTPVIGNGTFFKGLDRTFRQDGFKFAEQSGALLGKHTIGELYGDIYAELPLAAKGNTLQWATKMAQKLLGPSRWGNNITRAGVFNGVYVDALDSIRAFRKGEITQDVFLRKSHLWFTDEQVYSKFVARVGEADIYKGKNVGYVQEEADLAKQIALELVDYTQWPYRRGTQPAMLRTGLGRILGQYGTWPLNYAEFSTRLMKKTAEFPDMAKGSMISWAASNFAASQALTGIGADGAKWLWLSPASYTGSPQVDLIKDLVQSVETSDQGKAARARVLRYPINFIPGSIAARSIITAMERNEDMSFGGKGFMRAIGFKPYEEVQSDQDYSEWLLEESGVTANPYRR